MDLQTTSMPWCDQCGAYHHTSTPHIPPGGVPIESGFDDPAAKLPPSTGSAVEAALAYIKKPSDPKLYLVAVTSKDERPSWSDHDGMTVSARILATEVERLREQADAVCEWGKDDEHWAWETSCGESYCFEIGGPALNKQRFCPGCGRKVQVQPQTNEEQ